MKTKQTERLIDLKGIGPKVVQLLEDAGVSTPNRLREIGAIEAYLKIIENGYPQHRAMLYALVGAVENRHWNDVAQKDKARLTAEIEGLKEIGVLK